MHFQRYPRESWLAVDEKVYFSRDHRDGVRACVLGAVHTGFICRPTGVWRGGRHSDCEKRSKRRRYNGMITTAHVLEFGLGQELQAPPGIAAGVHLPCRTTMI